MHTIKRTLLYILKRAETLANVYYSLPESYILAIRLIFFLKRNGEETSREIG